MNYKTPEAFRDLELAYFGPNKQESAEIEHLSEILEGVTHFADVGASLGQYSYFAAKALKNAVFYCVEADPYKAARLRELTAKWEIETGNRFEVIEKAASDVSGELTFFLPATHQTSGAFFPIPGTDDKWEEVTVEAQTIDSIFKDIDIDFLKLDVEGAEFRALVGARKTMARCNLRLLLEIAPWGDKERSHRPSDVLRLLAGYGYDFTVFQNHYLFSKGGSPLKRWIKSRVLGAILDRPELKVRVKNLFNRLRRG
jgi:FkbM family methyltransferase